MKKRNLISTRKSIDSSEQDYFYPIELKQEGEMMNATDIRRIVNLVEQTDLERQKSNKYRLFSKINFLSLLNGFSKNSIENEIINFFDLTDGNSRYIVNNEPTEQIETFLELFDVYLCYPVYTDIGNNVYEVTLIPLLNKDTSSLIKCGFDKNIYGDKSYIFNSNITFDLSNLTSVNNLPLLNLYLYFDLKLNNNTVYFENNLFDNTRDTLNSNLKNNNFYIGKIKFDIDNYEFNTISNIETQFGVNIKYTNNVEETKLIYKPFIEYNIRSLSSYIENKLNINTIVPNYAINNSNGNVIWRDVLDYGFVEPDTGNGKDFPFINGIHYIYETKTFQLRPDIKDDSTLNKFDDFFINLNEENIQANNDLEDDKCIK